MYEPWRILQHSSMEENMEAFKTTEFYTQFKNQNQTVKLKDVYIDGALVEQRHASFRKLSVRSFTKALCRCANHHKKQIDCADQVDLSLYVRLIYLFINMN